MLSELFADFISLIFPEYCLGCHAPLMKGETTICTRCRVDLPKTDFHKDPDNLMHQKFWGLIEIEYAFAFLKFIKGGIVQKLLHQLKYYGQEDIGELLGKLYGITLKKEGFAKKFDVILPVPLHSNRLKQRGYNQCDAIARGIAEGLEIEMNTKILERIIANISQTKTQNLHERRENVKGIFAITQPELLQNKRVLLVDDVITTGSTLEACAVPIFEANCKSLSIATIAITTN